MAKKKEPGKFTVITRLEPGLNQEIIDAFDMECHAFNAAKILTFHRIRKLSVEGKTFSTKEQSAWNTCLQKKFHILKRTANSIIYEARTVWNMKEEASKTALQQDRAKRDSLVKEIRELEKEKAERREILEGRKPLKRTKKETDEKYAARTAQRHKETAIAQRNTRSKLVSKKKALDRCKTRIKKQEETIASGNYKICFGTKKLQSQDLEAFRAHRDHQMSFTGSRDENCQNGIFMLSYSKSRNQFDIRMRRDFYEKPRTEKTPVRKDTGNEGRPTREDEAFAYAHGRVHFSYGKKQIINALRNRSGALSYRIIKEDGEYYLYCIFDWKEEGRSKSAPSLNGRLAQDRKIKDVAKKLAAKNAAALGVDINKGFLSVSAANSQGALIHTFDMDYRFREGSKTKSDLEYLISRIVCLALMLDVPVVIEDINLSAKKWRSRKRSNRALNRMLHSFAYKMYIDLMEAACFRNGVKLVKVNPAWTSETARRKYCVPMKLCVHNGAAWMIARRGLKFYTPLPKKLSKEEKETQFRHKSRKENTGALPE